MRHNGIFISLEGGEGSGKSTQIKRLQRWLSETYPMRSIITTREPGGVESAEDIRNLLVQGATDRLKPKTDALLMLASRVEHVERLILPELQKDSIILCDRFSDSSFVYQAITGGYTEQELRDLHHLSIGDLVPHRTFLLDLPAEDGLARAHQRPNQAEARFEAKGLAYHKKVRDRFLALAHEAPSRFVIIDALQTEDEIFNILQDEMQKLISSQQTTP